MELMRAKLADIETIPYRIHIGVTGHRVTAEPGEIALCVDEVLDKLIPALIAAIPEKKL